jgi:glucose/arabinose dehydrogenase
MRFCTLAFLIMAWTVAEAQRPSSTGGSPEHHSDNEITWHILKPFELPAPEVSQLYVPSGFRIQKLDMIIHDLPDAGQHNTRTEQIENATILRASLDGKTRSIFASGLRHTVSWGWQPQTGELWGMDKGRNAVGDNLQPEELNHIEKGKRHLWPYLFGDNQANPHLDPPGGIQKSELAKTNVPVAMGYTAHAAPMQMSLYNASQFPAEYQGDAFVQEFETQEFYERH